MSFLIKHAKNLFTTDSTHKEREIKNVTAHDFLQILHNTRKEFDPFSALLLFCIHDIPNVQPIYILLQSWFTGKDEKYNHYTYHRVVLLVSYTSNVAAQTPVNDYDLKRIVLYLTQERNDHAKECKHLRLIHTNQNNFFDLRTLPQRKEKYFFYIDAMNPKTMFGIQHRRETVWKDMKKHPQLPTGKKK